MPASIRPRSRRRSRIIRRIAEQGVTIIVIEHLMKVVLSISHRVVVLHHGQLIAQGEPRSVVSDRNVIEAYLGAKYAAANAGRRGVSARRKSSRLPTCRPATATCRCCGT